MRSVPRGTCEELGTLLSPGRQEGAFRSREGEVVRSGEPLLSVEDFL